MKILLRLTAGTNSVDGLGDPLLVMASLVQKRRGVYYDTSARLSL